MALSETEDKIIILQNLTTDLRAQLKKKESEAQEYKGQIEEVF